MAQNPDKTSKFKGDERRRFQRIDMKVFSDDVSEISGAKAVWANGDESRLFDMSFSGAALTKPSSFELETGRNYHLEIKLSTKPHNEKVCYISGEVMWFNDNIVGIHFSPLSTDERMALSEFMDHKLLGYNLRLINKNYYAKEMDCDYWYHGPKDTNVYLWVEGNSESTMRVAKAHIELENQLMIYENNQLKVGGGASSEVQDRYHETFDFSISQELEKGAEFIHRTVEVLSQIPDPKGPIEELLKHLLIKR